MNKQILLKSFFAGTVSVLALSLAAHAQSAGTGTEEVVVTGSRVATGATAPTPLTQVSVQDLQASTPSNIPDALNKLPVFDGSRNQRSTGGSTINWPGNFLNLRNFGANRTLILLDGMRVPATDGSNQVDTNTLPQALMERVDVVTGGASAVYGSDAITGVVNFVLDHKFNGLKLSAQGGLSNHNDDASYKFGAVFGFDVFGGRGHFEASLEHYHSDGIQTDFTRPLGNLVPVEAGSGAATNPYHLVTNARNVQTTPGGYISNGPLNNMYFPSNGVIAPFTHGSVISGTIEQGGDGGFSGQGYYLFPNAHNQPSLLASLSSNQLFGRFDYDLTDDIHAFIMVNGSQSQNYSISGEQGFKAYNISSQNAYLPAAAKAALGCTGPSYPTQVCTTPLFQMSRTFYDQIGAISNGFTQNANVFAGLNGHLGLFGRTFDWDAHYTHGETVQHETSPFTINTQKLQAAMDAVVNPANGNIVCRVSLTAAGAAAYPGCQPLNVFGPSSESQSAFNSVTDNIGYKNINILDDFGASINGEIFGGWGAGPIKGALDIEYRNFSLETTSAYSPTAKVDCTYQGPACSTSPALWNGTVGAMPQTAENVKEAAGELDIPIIADVPLIKAFSVNMAGRYTEYSVSGAATTWKLGGVWDITDEIKLRGTISRDIRAPTLANLFAPLGANFSSFSDYISGLSLTPPQLVTQSTTVGSQGNPALKPEVARTNTVGFVYSPGWFPGFTVNADYYQISINNVINSISGGSQAVEQICVASAGTSAYCNLVTRQYPYGDPNYFTPANYPSRVLSQNLNAGIQNTHGVDFEVNYTTDMDALWAGQPGTLNARLLGSYQPSLLQISAIPGSPIIQLAGAEGGGGFGEAVTTLNFNVGYQRGPLFVNVVERYHSGERPSSNPTLFYTDPNVPAAYYTDLNVSYDFKIDDAALSAFASAENLFDRQPSLFIATGRTGAPGYAYPASFDEDIVGRYITLGVRAKL
jgi:outer membrane receptor protein involved in Fe transport